MSESCSFLRDEHDFVHRLALGAERKLLDDGNTENASNVTAFRSDPVPQGPSDEPASLLLKRICLQHAADGHGKGARGRPRVAPPPKQNGLRHTNEDDSAAGAAERLDLVVDALVASGRATSGLDASVIRSVVESLKVGPAAAEGKARGTVYRWLG